jgi:hypothetical protein
MRSVEDIEAYLGRLGRRYETVEGQPGTFLLKAGKSQPRVAVRVNPPIVLTRVDIGEITEKASPALFRSLLSANTETLLHTSFGLEGNRIVLSSALELENLDFNELEAVLDEIDLALAREVPKLMALLKTS